MNLLEVKNICKTYGSGETAVKALKDVSFSVPKGEYVAVVGESGSGKSTLLNMIGALDTPTTGKVLIDGKDIFAMDERKLTVFRRRNIGFIFQAFNLVPELTVEQNIIFPVLLDYQKPDKKYLEELLAVLNLKERRNHLPSQLSGGQQQRVALARALVIEPGVLLFDEPLSNLDAKLRVSMRTEIRRIQQEVGITAVYVTHDQSEAMALSDRIIIMRSGVVEQVGSPQEIYYHPVNEFVADFIGEANFLKGRLEALEGGSARIRVANDVCHAAAVPGMEVGKEYTIVLRPEAAALAEEGGLPCEVILSCFMGSYQNYHVRLGDTVVKLTDPNPKNKRVYKVGDMCRLVFDPESVHIL